MLSTPEPTERMMLVHVEVLRVDPDVQPRMALSEGTIREYAHLLQEEHQLGRIVVFQDGLDSWLADGFHRVAAARRIGLDELPALCYPSTRRDAIL